MAATGPKGRTSWNPQVKIRGGFTSLRSALNLHLFGKRERKSFFKELYSPFSAARSPSCCSVLISFVLCIWFIFPAWQAVTYCVCAQGLAFPLWVSWKIFAEITYGMSLLFSSVFYSTFPSSMPIWFVHRVWFNVCVQKSTETQLKLRL